MAGPLARATARIAALYGEGVRFGAGVLHVAAAWSDGGPALFSMRIGEATPRSANDAFALSLARARCDAIVTTGEILRSEPGLVHDARDEGLREWRRSVAGRKRPPVVAVLTRGGGLDLSHPALRAAEECLVFTGPQASADTRRAAREAGIDWVEHDAPGIGPLLDHLLNVRGLASVLVEAGPRTASELYQKPARIDELLLSICEAQPLPPGVRGAELPSSDRIAAAGLECVSEHRSAEESGPWRFRRYLRGVRAGAAAAARGAGRISGG